MNQITYSPEQLKEIFDDLQARIYLLVMEFRSIEMQDPHDSIPYLRVWNEIFTLQEQITNGNYKFKSADATHE
jgi:hypothetical protein